MQPPEIARALGQARVMLRVRHVESSVLWLKETLGLEPLHCGSDGAHPFAVYDAGGTPLSLWQLMPDESPPPGVLSCPYVIFTVREGIDEIRATLEARGVRVGRMRRSALARFFWFFDPDGNRFEVSQVGAGG